MNLVTLLKDNGVIDESLAGQVEAQVSEGKMSAEQALKNAGIAPEAMKKALADYYELPVESVSAEQRIDPEVMKYIPKESAEHYKMLPLRVEDGVLIVGVVDPENYGLRDALNFITAKYQMPYRLAAILEEDLARGLQSYENLSGEVGEALDEFSVQLDVDKEEAAGEETTETTGNIEHFKEDAPVTKIVATILRYAVDGNASDIHIEPYENRVVVRFRVDGVLTRSLELPKKVHSSVVARVKILTSLRLDERRKPQDGRFSAVVDKRKIDFRVSVLPTNHGEKIVLRILDTEKGVRTLEEIGASDYMLEMIRRGIRQPFGIILISGPTGSGKSTTLYAMLSEIDREAKNVLSLEDPVEYNIDGVSQSQVRPEIGYTFATGLRSALRQDPDVIMVGEIRDRETAQLAIQAALTGHLVFSTIHTNNALGVIPRLIDMGIDPYLIAPTLRLAIAQRLVRRICPGTGKPMPVAGALKKMVDEQFEDLPQEFRGIIPEASDVLMAEPSPECANGTKGRVAVMEGLEITDEIEQLILSGSNEDQLYKVGRKNGFVSMKEDAIVKAMNHTIPFEEVNTLGGSFLIDEEGQEEMEEESEPAPTPQPPVDNQKPTDTPSGV